VTTTIGLSYSAAANRVIHADSGIDYAYREIGAGEVPLILLQQFRGNLDYWDPSLVDALAPSDASSTALCVKDFRLVSSHRTLRGGHACPIESPWSMDVVEQAAGRGCGYALRNARRPAAAKSGAAKAAWSAPVPALEPRRARYVMPSAITATLRFAKAR
jgi:hypothetical protein